MSKYLQDVQFTTEASKYGALLFDVLSPNPNKTVGNGEEVSVTRY